MAGDADLVVHLACRSCMLSPSNFMNLHSVNLYRPASDLQIGNDFFWVFLGRARYRVGIVSSEDMALA